MSCEFVSGFCSPATSRAFYGRKMPHNGFVKKAGGLMAQIRKQYTLRRQRDLWVCFYFLLIMSLSNSVLWLALKEETQSWVMIHSSLGITIDPCSSELELSGWDAVNANTRFGNEIQPMSELVPKTGFCWSKSQRWWSVSFESVHNSTWY